MKKFILSLLLILNFSIQAQTDHQTGNSMNDEVTNVQSSNNSNCANIERGKTLCGDQLSSWCIKHPRKKQCSYYTKETVIYSKGTGTSEDASGVEVKAK